jgi:hypothetical protein
MSGYTPLFQSIVTSSIWNEDDAVRIVWITMLALADKYGIVEGSVPGLAHVARVSAESCRKALFTLESPDPDSRTKEHEGRRIHSIEGGWQIYNFAKFRQKAKSRAEYMRQYRELKRKETKEKNTNNTNYINANKVTPCYTPVIGVTGYTIQQCKDACFCNGIPESNAQSYFDQYASQGWKKGNGQQITNLQSHMSKRWNKVNQCWDFDEKKQAGGNKTKLYPIPGRVCGERGCGLPAIYKAGGEYDHYYCAEHMPDKVKEKYCF